MMDGILDQTLQDMTLEEYTPITLPGGGGFSAIERIVKSLIGRLLNPECQNIAHMLRTILGYGRFTKG